MTSLLLMLALSPLQAEDARVLMVGNSYTASNALHELVAQALRDAVPGWSEVGPHALTRGGATLADHAAEADGSHGDTPWRQALVTGPDAGSWDFVVLQDQSQVPGFPQSQAEWQASRDGAVLLDELIQQGGAETFLLMTWGRRDGDSSNPDRYPDFLTMQEHLSEGYLAYAEACGADGSPAWVIPAGLAWGGIYQGLISAELDPLEGDTAFTALYSSDGSHPSLAGSWLTALTAAAAITGRSVLDLEAPEGIDEELADTLRVGAEVTVLEYPFGEIPYRWAFDWDTWLSEGDSDASDGVSIADQATRPCVRLDRAADPVSTLRLGGEQSAGRLWIVEGGALEAAWLEACPEACELIVWDGRLQLGGGHAGTIHGGFELTGALELEDDYTLPNASALVLTIQDGDAPLLVVGGDTRLLGTLEVRVPDALLDHPDPIPLIRAAHIDLDLLTSTLPPGSELLLEEEPGAAWLSLRRVSDSNPQDTEDDADEDPTPRRCGCSSPGSPPQPWWLPIPLGLAWRRRASAVRTAQPRSRRSTHSAQPQRRTSSAHSR